MRDFSEFQGPMFNWPRVEAMPNVAETLAELHPRSTLALATNAADSEEADIWKALDRANISPFIDYAYCFRKIGETKPSRGFFDYILKDLNLDRSCVIMVGDDFEKDIRGANRCGIRAVWFNHRSDEVRTDPMMDTIHDFSELTKGILSNV